VLRRERWKVVRKAVSAYRRQFVAALLRARRVDGRFVCGLCGRRVRSEQGLVVHAAYCHPSLHREALLLALRKATEEYCCIPSYALDCIVRSGELPPPALVLRKHHRKAFIWG